MTCIFFICTLLNTINNRAITISIASPLCMYIAEKSLSAFNYAACPCKVEESHDVPRTLVQIRVNDAELAKRLECFVNRKRAEINSQNVIDFKSSFADSENDLSDSCARTQSTIIKQEQSNCHLKGGYYFYNYHFII